MINAAIMSEAEDRNAYTPPDLTLVESQPMSSQKKIDANRRNGGLSRGPITPEGKSRSRLNALKHGLFCNVIPFTALNPLNLPGVPGQKEYDELVVRLKEDFCPKSQLEVVTIEQMAKEILKLHLLQDMELNLFAGCYVNVPENLPNQSTGLAYMLTERGVKEILNKDPSVLQSKIEALQELANSISAGNISIFPDDMIEQLAMEIWDRIWAYTRSVKEQQDELRQIEIQLAGNLPARERRELIRQRKEGKRLLKVYIEHEGLKGPAACGVTGVDDVKAVIKGQRQVAENQFQPWQEIISMHTTRLKEELELHQKRAAYHAAAKQATAERLIAKMPSLNLFGQYAAMIRRNIDRCLKILRDAGVDTSKTIDLGSFC